MPKKVTVKKVSAPKKSLGAAVRQSLTTVKKAVYRAKSNQPRNTI